MQFTNINIKGLFGLYDYDIKLNNTKEDDKLTIITGPNGYGKTTILTILSALNPKDLFYFYQLRYNSIVITFDDDSVLSINQNLNTHVSDAAGDTKQDVVKDVNFIWVKKDGTNICTLKYTPEHIQEAKESLRMKYLSAYEDFKDISVPFDSVPYIDDKTIFENSEFNEIIAKTQDQGFFIMKLNELRTNFIPSNRIYNETKDKNTESPIHKINKDLQKCLKKAVSDFLKKSEIVDENFIRNVLSQGSSTVDENKYNELAVEVQQTQDILVKFQLAQKIEIPPFQKNNSQTLLAYLEGLKEKYTFYQKTQNLQYKLVTFDKLLHSKKFANKSISLNPQHGIKVVSSNGDLLDLDMLSSGEQNEIILLYKLIFEVQSNSILLIDEPENSLHVAWLNSFLENITEIAKTNNLQLILATHSPTIVAKGINNATDLYYLMSR